MKKNLFIGAAIFVIATLVFSSCSLEGSFSDVLLIGTWKEGTLYEKYLQSGDGFTWNTKDATEDEAQKFTWTLVKDRLTQKHVLQMGGIVPKSYTVKTLTSSMLVYEDDYGKSHTFAKVK